MTGQDRQIILNDCEDPEFDGWEWVSYWYPLARVVSFKRDVYRQALAELAPRVNKELRRRD
jgi:putative (di)nucleoside polyphosphate hydrolase